MATDRDTAYAQALLAIASAEGDLARVQDEIFAVARLVADNDDLAATLSDAQVPAARRSQIVEDLLQGRASSTTVALLSMVVAAGRGRELPAIAEALVALGAAEGGKQVAIVRSAVELTDDQRSRLGAALQASVGTPVEVRVVIDSTVMGGIVAQVGDTVIDGSVRRRLDQLKQVI